MTKLCPKTRDCVNCIWLFGRIQLNSRKAQASVSFSRQCQHRKTVKSRSDARVSFVRRHASRNEDHFIEREQMLHASSCFHVTVMHRIECASKNSGSSHSHHSDQHHSRGYPHLRIVSRCY